MSYLGLILIIIGCFVILRTAKAYVRSIRSSQAAPRSKGTTIVGAICVFAGAALVSNSILAYEDGVHKTFSCQTNLKAIGRALAEYTQDNNETLPPAKSWYTSSSIYVEGGVTNVKKEEAAICPSATSPFGYAFNSSLGSVAVKDIVESKTTAMVFESDSQTADTKGGKELVIKTPRHNGKQNVLFAYGFARNRDEKEMAALRWKAK
ncbi:MAG: hypothetical protein ABJA67_01130 [Chthonomonadales bacterium]